MDPQSPSQNQDTNINPMEGVAPQPDAPTLSAPTSDKDTSQDNTSQNISATSPIPPVPVTPTPVQTEQITQDAPATPLTPDLTNGSQSVFPNAAPVATFAAGSDVTTAAANDSQNPNGTVKKSKKGLIIGIVSSVAGVLIIGGIIVTLILTGVFISPERKSLIAKIKDTDSNANITMTCGEVRTLRDGNDFAQLIKTHNPDVYNQMKSMMTLLQTFMKASTSGSLQSSDMSSMPAAYKNIDFSASSDKVLAQVLDVEVQQAKDTCKGKSNDTTVPDNSTDTLNVTDSSSSSDNTSDSSDLSGGIESALNNAPQNNSNETTNLFGE